MSQLFLNKYPELIRHQVLVDGKENRVKAQELVIGQ